MPRLTVKRITSIGAVESGDNPEADILFWKAKDSKPKSANPSEGRINGGGLVDTLDLSSLDEETAEPILAFVAGLQKAATERDEKIAALEAEAVVDDEDDPLVDDNQWRKYEIEFDPFMQVPKFSGSPSNNTIRVMLEDFRDSGGVAGDVFFDNVTLSTVIR